MIRPIPGDFKGSLFAGIAFRAALKMIVTAVEAVDVKGVFPAGLLRMKIHRRLCINQRAINFNGVINLFRVHEHRPFFVSFTIIISQPARKSINFEKIMNRKGTKTMSKATPRNCRKMASNCRHGKGAWCSSLFLLA